MVFCNKARPQNYFHLHLVLSQSQVLHTVTFLSHPPYLFFSTLFIFILSLFLLEPFYLKICPNQFTFLFKITCLQQILSSFTHSGLLHFSIFPPILFSLHLLTDQHFKKKSSDSVHMQHLTNLFWSFKSSLQQSIHFFLLIYFSIIPLQPQ